MDIFLIALSFCKWFLCYSELEFGVSFSLSIYVFIYERWIILNICIKVILFVFLNG